MSLVKRWTLLFPLWRFRLESSSQSIGSMRREGALLLLAHRSCSIRLFLTNDLWSPMTFPFYFYSTPVLMNGWLLSSHFNWNINFSSDWTNQLLSVVPSSPLSRNYLDYWTTRQHLIHILEFDWVNSNWFWVHQLTLFFLLGWLFPFFNNFFGFLIVEGQSCGCGKSSPIKVQVVQ